MRTLRDEERGPRVVAHNSVRKACTIQELPFHMETGKETTSKVLHFQLRPNPPAQRCAFHFRLSSYLVTKLHHAVPVGFDLRQMEREVSVELVEERDAFTNQDGQDRIPNFVG